MSLKEELSNLYKAADTSAEAIKACNEFIKPKLIEAAQKRQTSVIIDVSALPDVIRLNKKAMIKWVEDQSLSVYYGYGNQYIFTGWSDETPKRTEDATEQILLRWLLRF
jgi:hypothetical protein